MPPLSDLTRVLKYMVVRGDFLVESPTPMESASRVDPSFPECTEADMEQAKSHATAVREFPRSAFIDKGSGTWKTIPRSEGQLMRPSGIGEVERVSDVGPE